MTSNHEECRNDRTLYKFTEVARIFTEKVAMELALT